MGKKVARNHTAVCTILLLLILGTGKVFPVPSFFDGPDSASTSAADTESAGFGSAADTDTLTDTHIDRIIASMNDTELLGQIFMLGYFGSKPSEEILHWIGEKKIGGVKIFGWNAEDLGELTESIVQMQRTAAQTRHSIPLFIATDQEGGWVRHVKGTTSVTPGNMAIGATGLPYDAYWSGYHIGSELKQVGINMNFAPTVDVYTNTEADRKSVV